MAISPKIVFNTILMISTSGCTRCLSPIEMMAMLTSIENEYTARTGSKLYDEPIINPYTESASAQNYSQLIPYYKSIAEHIANSKDNSGRITHMIRDDIRRAELIDINSANTDKDLVHAITKVWNSFLCINRF